MKARTRHALIGSGALLLASAGLGAAGCTSSRDPAGPTGEKPAPSASSALPPDPTSQATPDGTATSPPSPSAPVTCPPGTPKAPPADHAAEVDVVVSADRGPHGAAQPAKVDRKLLGMNIADWRPGDYVPTAQPTFLAYLKALAPGVLRWPAGHRSQEYVWEGGGGGSGDWTLTKAQCDAFIALARSVSAEPLVAINVKRGTTAAAADIVRYLNVEKAYGVKYFQIGNEPDLTDDITPSPEAYAAQLIAFSDAMRAVDPSVLLIGPEMLTGAHVGGINGTRDWMGPILTQAGSRVHGISWHYYPLDTGQKSPTSSATLTIPHLFQETATDWPPAALAFADRVMPALGALRDQHAPNASIWVTEFAEDPGPGAGAGISDRLAGALWVGDALGRYAEYAPGAVLRWLFKSGPEHAYALLSSTDELRPAYGAYWLYAQHVGDRFVETTTSKLTEVQAHAALKDDGSVSVVLVNKTTASKHVHVELRGATVCRSDEHTLTGAGYDAATFTVNGQALTTGNVSAGVAPNVLDPSEMFDVDLPATSMRVLVYRP